MRGRKAQFEVLGLAIIVVIVLFVILLTLVMMPKADQSTLQSDVADSTIASNLLNVILKTNLDCKEIYLKNLLQDCALGVTTKDYCYVGDNDPCGKVEGIIRGNILDKTLGVWKRNYTFSADVGTTNLFTITNTKSSTGANICFPRVYTSRFRSLTSESYLVPLGTGQNMEISLYICR